MQPKLPARTHRLLPLLIPPLLLPIFLLPAPLTAREKTPPRPPGPAPSPAAGRTVWLDELDLSQATTGYGKIGRNRSTNDLPLRIAGAPIDRGVAVHSRSEMLYRLDGKVTAFRAKAGIDDDTDGPGSVVFRIIADNRPVFDSGVMRRGDRPKDIAIDLTGCTSITLQVDDAGDGINFDHADWGMASFTLSGENPAPLPRWAKEQPHYSGQAPPPGMKLPGEILSPSGLIRAGVGATPDGHLAVQVSMGGKPVLEPSPVGIIIDGTDLGKDARIGASEVVQADETYSWHGNSDSHRNHYQGRRIFMTTGTFDWVLEVRAYDDGVAWRCTVPAKDSRRIAGESTAFILPENCVYWSHHDTRAYEGTYTRFTPKGNQPEPAIAMPVTVELAGGGYACLTEADTMSYSGMSLGPAGRVLAALFQDDPQGWTMESPIASPWRVVIAAPDLTTLVNSSIVANVCPPPDPDLFPEGYGSAWAAPGRAYWTWFFGGPDTAKWDRIRSYIDDAAALNCKYYVIDDPWREPSMGWQREGHDEWQSLKEFCEYGAARSIRLMVWQHWEGLRDLPAREEFFSQVAKAGAAGVKIDFMESESHSRLEFYRSCLKLGAKYHLLVNFHGANKPAGEERTWPDALTREGIRGLEQRGGLTRSHFAALPFTRLVTGPGDFTPTALRPDQLYATTVGLQLATAVVYASPLMHWADSAAVYLKQPAEVIDFIRTKPTVWDETLVLPGSKIGELAVFARRSGKDWWIAGLNGTDKDAAYSFALDFLKAPAASTTLIQDDRSDRTRFAITHLEVKSGLRLPVKMPAGGGFVMIVKGK